MQESLTRVTALSSDLEEHEFWLSNPAPAANGNWEFSVFADEGLCLATFTYSSRQAAERGRLAIMPVLCDALYVATGEEAGGPVTHYPR